MEVLVTGATGFVGRRLVSALDEAGHGVTAFVRPDGSPTPGAGLLNGVGTIEGDLLEFDAARSLEGFDAVYYLVHSMGAGPDFEELDRRMAHNFTRAASTAGIDRVVYLGGLGEARDRLSPHLRSRREVEAVLAGGEFALTVLRAPIIIGAGSSSFEMIRQLATRLPVMVTPRWVRTPCQPIDVRDVIAYLVGVLGLPAAGDRTFEIGGPEVLTYEAILRRTARIAIGREPIVLPVPVLSPRLSAYWVDLVTDVPRAVAHPLILGLKNPVVVTDHSIETLVPGELTSFDEAVEHALREGGHRVAGG